MLKHVSFIAPDFLDVDKNEKILIKEINAFYFKNASIEQQQNIVMFSIFIFIMFSVVAYCFHPTFIVIPIILLIGYGYFLYEYIWIKEYYYLSNKRVIITDLKLKPKRYIDYNRAVNINKGIDNSIYFKFSFQGTHGLSISPLSNKNIIPTIREYWFKESPYIQVFNKELKRFALEKDLSFEGFEDNVDSSIFISGIYKNRETEIKLSRVGMISYLQINITCNNFYNHYIEIKREYKKSLIEKLFNAIKDIEFDDKEFDDFCYLMSDEELFLKSIIDKEELFKSLQYLESTIEFGFPKPNKITKKKNQKTLKEDVLDDLIIQELEPKKTYQYTDNKDTLMFNCYQINRIHNIRHIPNYIHHNFNLMDKIADRIDEYYKDKKPN